MKLFIKTVYGLRYSNFDQVEIRRLYNNFYFELNGGYERNCFFKYFPYTFFLEFMHNLTSRQISAIKQLKRAFELCLTNQ